MSITFESRGQLERALRRTAEARRQHERQTGEVDADWPCWYATFIDREQSGPPAQAKPLIQPT